MLTRLRKWRNFLRLHRLAHIPINQPAQLMALSFLLLISIGTILLMLAVASKGKPLTFLQALFTATSASCVTGLVVLDTPQAFTLFGQLVILFLIQVGGLGIMTLSSFILWMMGRRMGLQSRYALGEILDEPTPTHLFRLMRTIVIATIVTEAFGALLLFTRWHSHPNGWLYGMYLSIFHAVSAFCNAGFALWSDSLVRFQGDVVINFTIIFLILAGSLGFPVFISLWERHKEMAQTHYYQSDTPRWYARLRVYWMKLPINTKVVLLAQPLLIGIATTAFFMLEYNYSIKAMSLPRQALVSLFQAVTLRTAGFNTIDFAHLSHATLLMMIVWMFIGGCSAGTAGGVKVNTIVVVTLSLRAMLWGREEVEVFGRAIPRSTMRRANVVIFTFISLLLLGCFALLLTHPHLNFARLLFEATSALGTVGLSINTTSQLNAWGQVILILLMFIGRIGPLTVALAIGHHPKTGEYRFPRERIQVG